MSVELFCSRRLFLPLLLISWVDCASASAVATIVRDHYVILRTVRVTPDWHGYIHGGGGFSSASPNKQTNSTTVYDIAIWEEIGAVHLYAFDATFSTGPRRVLKSGVLVTETPEEWSAHRESYRIAAFPNLPPASNVPERSTFLRQAFVSLFERVYTRHPSSGYILSYHGHGAGGMGLFENTITPSDSYNLLYRWCQIMGRRLECIDMGGPCNLAAIEDLVAFAPFCEYYVASDLQNGGYTFDDFTLEKFNATDVDYQFPLLLKRGEDMRQALVARINLKRQRYEFSRNDMIQKRVAQANYLFDARRVTEFLLAFKATYNEASITASQDVLDYIGKAGLTGIGELFRASIVHRSDNRDFFPWSIIANGAYAMGQRLAFLEISAQPDSTNWTPGRHVVRSGTRIDLEALPSPSFTRFAWDSSTAAGVTAAVKGERFNAVVTQDTTLRLVGNPPATRISNLSIRCQVGGEAGPLTVGVTVGGADTRGIKPLLLRAIGPTLDVFGVPNTLSDPRLVLRSGSAIIAQNDDWTGNTQVAAVSVAVGAFALNSATSRDAGLNHDAAGGSYTIEITGPSDASGVALTEVYDVTAPDEFNVSTPRLINVSALTRAGSGGDVLIAGFTIAGLTPKTVLLRGIGPALSFFGVPSVLNDPTLALFRAGAAETMASNDNWSSAANAAEVATTAANVGAFALVAGSRDAALLVTLRPGSYTAHISGVAGTSGRALVEVYEVP